ncbi:GDP-mannose 4,6-dehydratase [Microbacterium aoyamense]|uniref:GDP-mannose 4,6-dehydratase n=1 Tax=Microbacterium aoyamense TaxID=344166 RepID=A0ABN2PN20_9MICO|nr:GDP-mannose 4,6-dehydratase [Microbacterium aoyamense]
MSRRVLAVTGANGFVGAHVAALAAEAGAEVWAIAREDAPRPELAPYASRYYQADLAEEWPAPEGPTAVVHLAGLAAVGPSFDRPQEYLTVNSAIMTTMSESLRTATTAPRVVVVSTGAVYSPPDGEGGVSEDDPLVPGSPYAVAKILVETQADYYARRGLDTVVARPFNHIGPGQSPGFLVPDLALAIESAPSGTAVQVGNIDAARDFTDVRDVARAYLLLAFADDHRHHVYNVASGEAHSGREILEEIARGLGRDVPPLEVDPARLRPNDPARIVGDASRLRSEFGWQPTIGWRRSIEDFLAARA